jgi:predicted NBD/HSP70 family sugar kinase
MGVSPRPASQGLTIRSQGPPSEGVFIRALRDQVLAAVDVTDLEQRLLGLSLVELEDLTGLSRPSITALVKRFRPVLVAQDIDGKSVDPDDPEAARWTLDPDAGTVVGMEIGHDARVAIGDLYGRIHAVAREAPISQSAQGTIDWAVETIQSMCADRVAPVLGIGVSITAPVDQDIGGVRPGTAAQTRTPADVRWADWELTRIREHLQRRLGWADVLIENDANVSALAEYLWGAAQPSRIREVYANVLYIEWSRGIGAGLILNGQLYRGCGAAGEVGHTIITEHKGNDGLRVCPRCGRTGCLEMAAAWEQILRAIPPYNANTTLEDDDLAAALRAASEPGPEQQAFATAAEQLGRVLGPTIHLLNPELVVIGGDIGTRAWDLVKTDLLDSIKGHTMRPALADATIVPAGLAEHRGLYGAISLLIRPVATSEDVLLAFLQG